MDFRLYVFGSGSHLSLWQSGLEILKDYRNLTRRIVLCWCWIFAMLACCELLLYPSAYATSRMRRTDSPVIVETNDGAEIWDEYWDDQWPLLEHFRLHCLARIGRWWVSRHYVHLSIVYRLACKCLLALLWPFPVRIADSRTCYKCPFPCWWHIGR